MPWCSSRALWENWKTVPSHLVLNKAEEVTVAVVLEKSVPADVGRIMSRPTSEWTQSLYCTSYLVFCLPQCYCVFMPVQALGLTSSFTMPGPMTSNPYLLQMCQNFPFPDWCGNHHGPQFFPWSWVAMALQWCSSKATNLMPGAWIHYLVQQYGCQEVQIHISP